jgi:hypothetical protein
LGANFDERARLSVLKNQGKSKNENFIKIYYLKLKIFFYKNDHFYTPNKNRMVSPSKQDSETRNIYKIYKNLT